MSVLKCLLACTITGLLQSKFVCVCVRVKELHACICKCVCLYVPKHVSMYVLPGVITLPRTVL